MRWAKHVLLLLIGLGLALEVQHQLGGIRSHPSSPAAPAAPAAQARAEHLLTLLDFWNQELMPYILLPQSRAHAIRSGDLAAARKLDARLIRGLAHLQRLLTDAVRDPLLLADDSVAPRAVEATRAAWAEWTSATLRRRPPAAAGLAALEANAVRLDQAAYEAVNASLHAALKLAELHGPPRAVAAAHA
jgi:hypothetical protein